MVYYISNSVEAGFEEAERRIRESLAKEGFGILTEIDVDKTFKAKLGVDFRRYKILGACNPHYAHKALQEEDKIGVMLPCSIILQDMGDGITEIAAIDPVAAMRSIDNPAIEGFASDVREKLARAVMSI
ncbi:MAG: DUF302 domain-containing protein [Bacteroidetes bacterium]|nr:DUF302 domain-containing protein [Bacteroidota bacterium]